MKIKIVIFLLSIHVSLFAQLPDKKQVLTKADKYLKGQNLDSFTLLVNKVISSTTSANLSGSMVIMDSLFEKTDGAFAEGCDTFVLLLQRKYFVQMIKYLSKRKDSNFEIAFINHPFIEYPVPANAEALKEGFEQRINAILPWLNATEKEYAFDVKRRIFKLVDDFWGR